MYNLEGRYILQAFFGLGQDASFLYRLILGFPKGAVLWHSFGVFSGNVSSYKNCAANELE